MKKRYSLKKGRSQHVFRKGAKSHNKNFGGKPMRGGIRL